MVEQKLNPLQRAQQKLTAAPKEFIQTAVNAGADAALNTVMGSGAASSAPAPLAPLPMTQQLRFVADARYIENKRNYCQMGKGETIFFGRGDFDDWAAFSGKIDPATGLLMAARPKDTYYFEILSLLAPIFGNDVLFEDIKKIFDHCGNRIEFELLKYIQARAFYYGFYHDDALNAFLHIYYGMVAENNKDNTVLGASIKMLGVHRLLKESIPVDIAATEFCGQAWHIVQRNCAGRDIIWMDPRNPCL